MKTVPIEYIEVDDTGVARIAGTRLKIMHLVLNRLAEGGGREDIQARFPQLTVAQVDAALAYYGDHRGEIDAAMARIAAPDRFETERLRNIEAWEGLRDWARECGANRYIVLAHGRFVAAATFDDAVAAVESIRPKPEHALIFPSDEDPPFAVVEAPYVEYLKP